MFSNHGTRIERDYTYSQYEVDGYQPRYTPINKMQGVFIDTNIPHVVSMHYQTRQHPGYADALAECIVTLKFTPQDNHHYAAVFSPDSQHCTAAIIDLTLSQKINQTVYANGLSYMEKKCDMFEYYPE